MNSDIIKSGRDSCRKEGSLSIRKEWNQVISQADSNNTTRLFLLIVDFKYEIKLRHSHSSSINEKKKRKIVLKALI